ncbi:MAG: hypothetical protein HZC42_14485 [Candidatus Eisenbacteria bacterium]|nr:hypothetical protein [Candidatus Eisenbacteria bacterium]
MNAQVLIVDVEQRRAATVVRALDERYRCSVAPSVTAALEMLPAADWYAVLADFDLDPGFTGIELLQEVRDHDERILRVLYASAWSTALAREARRHAHAHAAEDAQSTSFPMSLRTLLDEHCAPPGGGDAVRSPSGPESPVARWCAVAPATRRFLDDLRRAAESESHVFVHGESGSGKRLAAATLKHWRRQWRSRQGPEGPRPPSQADATKGAFEPTAERSAIAVLEVPPLRDRRQDIPGLAAGFLRDPHREASCPMPRLSDDALLELLHREWLGNVRELHDVLRRACLRLGSRAVIELEDLPRDRTPLPNRTTVTAKDSGQRKVLLRHLQVAGAVQPAARRAGIPRPNFMRMMKRLGVLRADTAPDDES